LYFLLVGGLNTLFAYMMFALFLSLNCHYAVASFLVIVCGILFNFKTYGRLVFNSHDNSLIFRFVGFYCFIYVIATGSLFLFNLMGINLYFANAIMIAPLSALSFFLIRRFVFLS
jgi:putative flippase GtrA